MSIPKRIIDLSISSWYIVFMNIIGQNIKKARETKKMSQKKLAEVLGVQTQTVWRWENGAREPGWSTLRSIAIHLNIRLTDLVGNAEDSVPKEVEGESGYLGLSKEELDFWKKQSQLLDKLLNAESPNAFAQVEDIYIDKINDVKHRLYHQEEWAQPDSPIYSLPFPEELGGLIERVHNFYGVPPCQSINDEKHMGYRIKLLREMAGFSIEELAEKINIAPETVWRWEHLREAIAPPVPKVAAALGVTISQLLGADSVSQSPSVPMPVTLHTDTLIYEYDGKRLELPATPEGYALFEKLVVAMMTDSLKKELSDSPHSVGAAQSA